MSSRSPSELDVRGWTLCRSVLSPEMAARLAANLLEAYSHQRQIQIRNGIGGGTDGTVHHLPLMGGSFLDLLERNPCANVLREFFGGPYILNTFGGVLNLPDNLSYIGNVHRDLRTFSGELPLMAQLLVMLDDFTEENGATYLLDGSHKIAAQPLDEEFYARASRAVGPAGSVVVFNSNLWHAAGVNRAKTARRALTLAFTRPFVKQQLDYPRALGEARASAFSPGLRQVLGYNARVPTTLDEWYQPSEKRLYQRDQG